MPKLTVKQLPVKDLVPYAHNARIHSAEQIDTIKASIEQFGFNDPVGVWTNKNGQLEIVEGHGRVLAAEQLGIEKVPTINLDHLTDEERRAYSIVHNQTTDNSMFDEAILSYEMGELNFDWEEFGLELSSVEENTKTPVVKFEDTLGVFVECQTEGEQESTYQELVEGGYSCRLLTL